MCQLIGTGGFMSDFGIKNLDLPLIIGNKFSYMEFIVLFDKSAVSDI